MRNELSGNCAAALKRWLLLTAVCVVTTRTLAQSHISAFESANTLYDSRRYPEAAAAYSQIEAAGSRSAALYYNLGNTYFKSGRLGEAIAAYLKAEALAPRDPDIRANLRFAREQRQGPSAAPTLVERWLSRFTLNEWSLVLACGTWVFFLYLVATQLRFIPRSTTLAVLLGLLTAGLFLCTWQAWSLRQHGARAIIVVPEVVGRTGPLEESSSALTLHDGAELRVLDRKDEWLQVAIDPKRIAWVKTNQVVISGR
jgi:tetratricopeptide (TPR) repeat protein